MRFGVREAMLGALALLSAPVARGQEPVLPRQTGGVSDPVLAHFEGGALVKRQQSCPNGYFSCANISPLFSGICCFSGSSCAQDESGQPACCPTAAVCTGTAPPAIPTGAGGGTLAFVPNSFYPFPYMTTSFANPAQCTAAIQQCAQSYTTCILDLEGLGGRGPGYAVTISVAGGGGTTVAGPTVTLAPASAVSVCSSLSSVGCYNLQTPQCTLQNGGGGFIISSAHRAIRPGLLLAASFGLGVFLVLRHVL